MIFEALLVSALLWLFYLTNRSKEASEEDHRRRDLRSIYMDYPDPKNYRKNMNEWRAISLEIDRNKSLRERNNQYNTKTSHVKTRLAEEMFSDIEFVKMVHPMAGRRNRNITREKEASDVIVLMTHLYPFPTQCFVG